MNSDFLPLPSGEGTMRTDFYEFYMHLTEYSLKGIFNHDLGR